MEDPARTSGAEGRQLPTSLLEVLTRQRIVAAVLAAITLTVFLQVLTFGFVGFDDQKYITANPHIRQGLTWSAVAWAFTTHHGSNWMPLTWLSLMADVDLFSGYALGFHLTNLLLHLANVLLLFYLLERMTGRRGSSAFVSALFAVHPLHVETVAWAFERKGLLSTLFGLLALHAWVRYVGRRERRWYGVALALYLCSLASKQMLVSLPFLLLLLDYWPLERWPSPAAADASRKGAVHEAVGLVWEKLPFFAASAIFSAIAYWAQASGGAVVAADRLPLPLRLANAVVAYALYLEKTIWPVRLAIFYPHPRGGLSWTQVLGAAAMLAGGTLLVVAAGRSRRHLAVGWLWFLGTLVPVIGLVQIGGQRMADRYSYVPLIGLFLMVAWGVPSLFPRGIWRRRLLSALGLALVAASMAVATVQSGTWRDQLTVFRHAVEVTEDNYLAHSLLGNALFEAHRPEEAAVHFREALRIRPAYPNALLNLGDLAADQGDLERAVRYYRAALAGAPRSERLHYRLGSVLEEQGRLEEAEDHYRQALALDPDFVLARRQLGSLLVRLGETGKAVEMLRETVRLAPDFAAAHATLADALLVSGDATAAVDHLVRACQLDPEAPGLVPHLLEVLEGQGLSPEQARRRLRELAAPDR